MPKIGKFTGLNNVSAAQDAGTGDLQTANNVIVTDAGRLVSIGTDLQVAATAGVSLVSYDGNLICYSGTDIDTVPAGEAPIIDNLTDADYMDWLKINDVLYYSNGVETGRISSDLTRSSWGYTTPGKVTLTEIGGTLNPGTYNVSITWIDALGRESGASEPETITVTSGAEKGGIEISGFPTSSPDTGVTECRIYVTDPDGEILPNGAGMRALATVTAVTDPAPDPPLTYDYTDGLADGPRCVTLGLEPMPAVRYPCFYRGRVYGAVGANLFYSERVNYDYCNYGTGYITFESDIRAVIPVENGIWVGTENDFMFLAGMDPLLESGFQIRGRVSYPVSSCAVQVDGARLYRRELAPGKVALLVTTGGIFACDSAGVSVDLTRGRWVPGTVSPLGSGCVLIEEGQSRYTFSISGSVFNMTLANGAVATTDSEYVGLETHDDYQYGAWESGIYKLDVGQSAKSALVVKNTMDLGVPQVKKITDLYFYLATAGDIGVRIEADGIYTADVLLVDNIYPTIHGSKVDTPRGIRGRAFDIEFWNDTNSHFDIKEIEFIVEVSRTRRGRQVE